MITVFFYGLFSCSFQITPCLHCQHPDSSHGYFRNLYFHWSLKAHAPAAVGFRDSGILGHSSVISTLANKTTRYKSFLAPHMRHNSSPYSMLFCFAVYTQLHQEDEQFRSVHRMVQPTQLSGGNGNMSGK